MMFFHKAELAGYSSVVGGQPIILSNRRGECIGHLSLTGYVGADYRQAASDIADALNEITALRAQLAAADADRLAAMERVREAAAKACICTIAERRIDNSLEHERRIEARILALKLDALAKGEK